MDHTAKSGVAKLVLHCDLPLTGKAVVSRVITELGVFDVTGTGFAVVELADGVDLDEVTARTGAPVVSTAE
jgi:3-oxoacid CoA-transferase subunit B